jgi:L-amino acid N-acyltransferase YncA
MQVREYRDSDINSMIEIWNEVVLEGNAFPQVDTLDEETGSEFFASQSYTGVAVDENDEVAGLYILHPNNIGRCGHISNASYAVNSLFRGRHIGELLVRDCLTKAKELGFRLIQFNAVVESNAGARHLYEKLGFSLIGTVPGGFLMKDGSYENICLYYKEL